MEKAYKMCQSCGMPMKKDPNGGGTEKDGSKSTKYCSYCYKDGDFTMQCSAKEMQDFCVDMMTKKMHMPKLFTKFLCHNIPNLERWKDKK